jgi:hypothetical protein
VPCAAIIATGVIMLARSPLLSGDESPGKTKRQDSSSASSGTRGKQARTGTM